jgi:hypothetical protein
VREREREIEREREMIDDKEISKREFIFTVKNGKLLKGNKNYFFLKSLK